MAAITIALVTLVALDITGVARIALTLAFVTFAPGWAALGHSRMADGVSKIAMAVAVSLTVCTGAATVMVWLRAWRPSVLFYGLGATSLVGLLWGATRSTRTVEPGAASVPVELGAVSGPVELGAAPVPVEMPASAMPVPDDVTPVDQPRRSAVVSGRLCLIRVSVRVMFQARPPFAAKDLIDFFAGVSDRHPFTDFHRDGDDGAVLETAESQRLEIRRNSVVYSETKPLDFAEAKQHVVYLLGEVQRHFEVGTLANPSCRLHATLASDAGGLPSRLLADAAQRHAPLLGTGPVGVGVRFTGQSDDPRHTWQAMLEPAGADGLLSLDVTTDFPLPADNPSTVGGFLERSHHFLTTGVVPFVEALAAPPVDEPSSSDGRSLGR